MTTDTPATPASPSMIAIVDQRSSATCTKAFRVELRDAHGLVIGCGYGQSPEAAYAAARQDYIESRATEQMLALRDADLEFLRERRGLKTSPETR